MNFTMVIADDEPLVLKSLEMLVAKNFPNIQVAGLAENGVELKELLERLSRIWRWWTYGCRDCPGSR